MAVMRWFLLALLLAPSVLGVAIEGTVYDLGLNPVTNSIVQINTTPNQKMVAKDGSYKFNVPIGTYLLTAISGDDWEIEEQIEAKTNGSFVLDLILLPTMEDIPIDSEISDNIDNETQIDSLIQESPRSWLGFFAWFTVFALLAYFISRVSSGKKNKPVVQKHSELADELKNILRLLKDSSGRLTQKELRKQVPFSEAKVSLMLAQLEDLGKIQRIKKGRANIIILK